MMQVQNMCLFVSPCCLLHYDVPHKKSLINKEQLWCQCPVELYELLRIQSGDGDVSSQSDLAISPKALNRRITILFISHFALA